MSDEHKTRPSRPEPEIEEIPVDELIRITREFTRRITNQDRQRLGGDLRESGHVGSLEITAPLTLQQFFAGEIDLDADLVQRFLNAPLLSHVRYSPRPNEPARRQSTAIFGSQDDSAVMTVDAHLINDKEAQLEFTFTLFSALAMRFTITPLVDADRRRWLRLMLRKDGIAFLWTRDRWEKHYIIFVIRENFARMYAFSPEGQEAAARLTPDMKRALLTWLIGLWFPGEYDPDAEPEETRPKIPAWDRRPTKIGRPTDLIKPAGSELLHAESDDTPATDEAPPAETAAPDATATPDSETPPDEADSPDDADTEDMPDNLAW